MTEIVSKDAWEFIKAYQTSNSEELLFKPQLFDGVSNELLVKQISGRSWARSKAPFLLEHKDYLFGPKLSLEQCSSSFTAVFKAKRLSYFLKSLDTGVDLTAGLGIDSYFLGKHFNSFTSIEYQNDLIELLKHNYRVLNSNNETIQARAEDYVKKLSRVDFIYIDPARRGSKGEKTVTWENCTPNLLELLPTLLEKARSVAVKASPLIDITESLRQFKGACTAIDIISVRNEVKELLFWLSPSKNIEIENVPINHFNITSEKEQQYTTTLSEIKNAELKISHQPLKYIYDPSPSFLKTRAFRVLCIDNFNLYQLGNSSLLTSDVELINFQGRCFLLKEVLLHNKKMLSGIKKKAFSVISKYSKIRADTFKKTWQLKESSKHFLILVGLDKVIVLHCERNNKTTKAGVHDLK
jgi:16S rRNA G966 N2-methylase RsmD